MNKQYLNLIYSCFYQHMFYELNCDVTNRYLYGVS